MTEGILDLQAFLLGGVTGQGDSTEPYSDLTYPLSLPTVRGIKQVQFELQRKIIRTESPWTFKAQTQRRPGERWRVEVDLPIMPKEDADQWESFLLLLRGGVGTVYFGDPLRRTPRGLAYGDPVIYEAGQYGNTLQVSGWNPNVTGILKAGDWIQLANRLHKNCRDVDSDGSGITTLDIEPRIRQADALAAGYTVITENTKGIFRVEDSSIKLSTATRGKNFVLPSFVLVEDI